MFSLELPHQGDSPECTQHSIINIKMKITKNYPKFNNVCSYEIFWLGTQERVINKIAMVNKSSVFESLNN